MKYRPTYDREAHGPHEDFEKLMEEFECLRKHRWTKDQIIVGLTVKCMQGLAMADYDVGVNPRHKNINRILFKAMRYTGVNPPQHLKDFMVLEKQGGIIPDDDEGYGRPVVEDLVDKVNEIADRFNVMSSVLAENWPLLEAFKEAEAKRPDTWWQRFKRWYFS